MNVIHSEDELLELISQYFPNTHPRLILGRGDDCAELACSSRMVISTDLFIEDSHFRQRYFLPYDIGYKALAINLSDMAAAGARPVAASVGLMLPVPFSRSFAEEMIQGMAALASEHDLALSGGDIAKAPLLGFCISILGEPCCDTAPFLRRGPVQPGDTLFVCGYPGLTRLGFHMLEHDGRNAIDIFPEACAAHLRPVPLVKAGQALTAIPGCCLMDLSDGMARDLPRLLGPCGAKLSIDPHTLHPELLRHAALTGLDPVLYSFIGGEEYGLLGSCPAAQVEHVMTLLKPICPVLSLGTVSTDTGIYLNGTRMTECGFDHFTENPGI